MGADARLSIHIGDPREAQRLVELTLGEIERLERCFSLYRSDSELVRLNTSGILERPSQDFRILLSRALAYWTSTEGAFNPAVQPLWSLLARYFARSRGAGDPDPEAIAAARALADPGRINVNPARVRMAPGMALTFNGIAQGYVTDRVSELLIAQGAHDTLVQLGELRVLPGRSWDVRVAPVGITLAVEDAALATSEPNGTRLSTDGRWHHLLDPHTGRSSRGMSSVTVKAPSATEADALSTSLTVAGAAATERIAERFPQAAILLRRTDGGTEYLGRQL